MSLITELTLSDLMLLEHLRMERLRGFFAETLLQCILYFDRYNMLTIHCPAAWIVDALLIEIEELCEYAWLVLGANAIALCITQEEIYRIEHCGVCNSTRKLSQYI